MNTDAVAIAGFVVLFILMLLRVPVGMAMGLVGVTGFGVITGAGPALKLVGQTSMRTVTDYTFGVIPMFLLMGAFVSASGMSRELFRAANTVVGHLRGGLGLATIAACAAFAAISGSSVATAATFATVAYPEMRRFGYPQSFAAGVVAVGGTLGAMFPPSTVLVVRHHYRTGYWETVHGRRGARPARGRAPLHHHLPHRRRAAGLPSGRPAARLDGTAGGDAATSGRRSSCSCSSSAASTATVHAHRGRRHGRRRRVPDRRRARTAGARGVPCLALQATRTAAAVFTILIGALLFGYFLTITQTPQKVTAFLTALPIGRYGVLALILLMYLVLGCLMDAMAMVILTVPIIFPVITALGFDPIWFGVIIVMTVELGLIHPPVGMNVFVKERGRRRSLLHDLRRRASVHRHRPAAPGHPDRVSPACAVAAFEDVKSAAVSTSRSVRSSATRKSTEIGKRVGERMRR